MADDWAIYRIVTHEATRGQPLSDILERWTFDDVDAMNEVLNGIDHANARAHARALQERAKPRTSRKTG